MPGLPGIVAAAAPAGITLTDGKWHHVAFVRDLTGTFPEGRWYVDGMQNGSYRLTDTSTISLAQPVTIGA